MFYIFGYRPCWITLLHYSTYMQLKKTKITFNNKLIMNFNMHSDDSKTEVTFNNNSITWMLFEQVLTSTSWLANTQRPNWRSFLRDGYLFSVLGIYIWKSCFVSQVHCWCLLRGLDHIYEPKPNAKKDEIIDCWIFVLMLKKKPPK